MTPQFKTLASYGARGSKVRVYVQGDLVRVRWRINGARKHRSWPNTAEGRQEAKAFAVGLFEARRDPAGRPKVRLTLRQLWERYQEAEYPSLRPKSQERYLERWRKWERFLGREFIAEDTTQENADRYRTARAELGIAVNQIAEEVKMAKMVYAWGQRRRLLGQNDLALYRFKIAKEDRSESPDEYRVEDFRRILATFTPTVWGQWRPWALLTLLGTQGVRTNAARHLQWADVDLEAGVLTWRAAFDKLGREWAQPLREATRDALRRCRVWRERTGYSGPWVFFSEDARKAKAAHEPIYGHQALAAALRSAERTAKVPHIELRAMHGLRRMVVGEIVRLTGDLAAAAQFIGDTDLRVVNRSYLKRRLDQLQAVADRLDADARKGNPSATESAGGEPARDGVTTYGEPQVGFEPTTAPLNRNPDSRPPIVYAPVSDPDMQGNDTPIAATSLPETATEAQPEPRP